MDKKGKTLYLEDIRPSVNTSTECGKLKEMKSINSESTKVAEIQNKPLGE